MCKGSTIGMSAALAVVILGACAGVARADFSGQTILGPLSNGSSVFGDTSGKSDENDGLSSGFHPWGVWDGGDDVWQLDWLGGDMTVNLTSLGGSDNDLFLYEPGSYDDSFTNSYVGAFDTFTLPGAAAGTYYILIDTTFFSEGSYGLEVVPAPSVGAIAGLGAMMLGGRRRR